MPNYATVFQSERIVDQDYKTEIENPIIIVGREEFDDDMVKLREEIKRTRSEIF